jgi:brefeldin A-inhibited guanine nucleotide-exchange protein 3
VHDIISSLLHHHTEMSHFHFNESLFKPFESLLLLELCDSDVQVRFLFKGTIAWDTKKGS